jgi:hypothetical protein
MHIWTAGPRSLRTQGGYSIWSLRARPCSEARSRQEPPTSHRLATNALGSRSSTIGSEKELCMAKALFVQKTGALGASVYQGGRYGTIERARVIPTNPQTNAQQNARSILAAVASEWRQLSDPVRTTWKALAAQLPGNLTGFQAYVQVNATLVTYGLPKLETPPDIPAFGIMSATGLTADDTPTLKLTQLVNTVAPDKFIIEATPALLQGQMPSEVDYRVLSVIAGHAAPAADADLTAAYTAKFGALTAGRRIGVRVFSMQDGFKGIPLAFQAIVVAAGA